MYFFDIDDYCGEGFIGVNSVDFSVEGDWSDLPLSVFNATRDALAKALNEWYFSSTAGRIQPVCEECDDIKTQLEYSLTGDTRIIDFWDNATNNNMVDVTQVQYENYQQAMFEQMCLFKQLMNCIDGDTFENYSG